MTFRASYHQERLWFIDKFEAGNLYESSPVYHNIPLVFRIKGELDAIILEKSIKAVIHRHEALRTRIITKDSQPFQVVEKEMAFKLEILDLTGHSEKNKDKHAVTSAINFAKQPFRLEEEFLVRAKLIQTPGDVYLLVISIHHIIVDRYSLKIITGEIFSHYDAFLNGKVPVLPVLSVHYVDFSQWQHGFSDEILEPILFYWKRKLKGNLQPLELPTDKPRAAVHIFHDGNLQFKIDRDLFAKIEKFCHHNKTFKSLVLLAAFKILLYRYSGQEEIIIGMSEENRTQPGMEHIVGPIAALLVLRSFLDEKSNFLKVFEDLKKTIDETRKYKDIPFERLDLELKPPKDMSRTVFFDVLFHYQKNWEEAISSDNLEIKILETNLGYGKYDLNLLLQEGVNSISGFLVFNRDYYNHSTIDRFITHYIRLVENILENQNREISDLYFLTEEEKNQLLFKFNELETGFPRDKTIHRLFEEQVERTPGHVALSGRSTGRGAKSDEEKRTALTYEELNEKSNQLAYFLKDKGAGPDTIAGIMVEPSIEMIIGILAILKAGGAYMPIDPDYPEERKKYMLKDSSAKILLAAPDLKSAFEPSLSTLTSTSNCQVSPTNLAYIIYTSGTTGRPKGVMIEHRNVVRLMFNEKFQFDFGSTDIWTMFHSSCFDFSVWEMYGALLYGAKLILISKTTARDPQHYLRILKEEQVTVLNQTPAAFYNLSDAELHQPGSQLNLKYVIFGGEALKPGKLKKWRDKYPGTKLINMFGITETTVHVTYKELQDREIGLDISNIGRPIPTLCTYVMDKNLKLQPTGVAGELCVGGEGVGRGYLNRPELTETRFIENPYVPGQILYRSGDLGRISQDDQLEYLGRIDQQVKIRGFRIELGEIENRLLNHGKIKETVVLAKEDDRENKYLCAYIVTGSTVEVSELREFLSRLIPEHMIPSFFIQVEKIPLTSSGKIDRQALPEPKIKSENTYAQPRNEVEEILVKIWSEVLGAQRIGVNDNFFEVGGDSIKAIQISARLNKVGYKLEIKDIFINPLISELAPKVKKIERIADQSVIEGVVPLTHIQKYFFEHFHINPHHFNQSVMLYTREGLDETVVKSVFTKVQEHHDALRMVYPQESGKIVQLNRGAGHPCSIEVYDFRGCENAPEALTRQCDRIQADIDLQKGPLMKVGLFHLDDGDRLLIALHHLVVDGVSWRILLEDIEALYLQYKNGQPLKLPLKTDSFKLWAEKLAQYANSPSFLREKTYWARLESKEIPGLKKDFQEKSNFKKDEETLSFNLDDLDTETLLKRVNKAFATEINDILLTALAAALKKIFGHDLFLIALEGHGREEILESMNINRTVGWFTSIFPVLLNVSFENDLARQVKEIKETLHQTPNKGIGYGILKYLTAGEHKIDMDFKLNPQICFNYWGQLDAELKQMSSFEIAKESPGNAIGPGSHREYQFDVSGMIVNKRLSISITYNRKHYKAGTVEALLNEYRHELIRIINFCANRERRELTPSDFTYTGLSIETVDRLQTQYSYLITDIYPLTPTQEGMLFYSLYHQNRENSTAYFEQYSYRLQGELDILFVEKSVNELFIRYDILRTVFIHEGLDRPLQLVLKNRAVDFHFEDLHQVLSEPGEREKYTRDFKEKDKQRGFDLSKDVLMRISVIRLEENRHEFTWSFHHILMDGWCVGILIAEYLEIYLSFLENRVYQLSKVNPYRNYIQWLQEQETGTSKKYWRAYLEGYEEPASIPRVNSFKEYDGKYKPGFLGWSPGIDLSRGLNRLAIKNKVTLNVLLQTIWGILLGRYNNRCDVVLGAVVSGRPSQLEGIESMVGLFINTIPLRIRFDEKSKFKSLIRYVHNRALESEPHHYFPLAEIQAACALKQNLLDHIWVFENYPIAEQIDGVINQHKDKDNKLKLEVSEVAVFEQTNYDFNVIISGGNQIGITFIYNMNRYEEEFLKKVISHFNRLIQQVLENNNINIDELTLLTHHERNEILYTFNDTGAEYPVDKSIHRLFEEQRGRTPDNIALIGPCPGVIDEATARVSYGELHEKSNRLANLLMQEGVGPGSIVGIKVERSIEMIIGILGILKAGGAYLPIDPGYPQERCDYILEDSNARILLDNDLIIKAIQFTDLMPLAQFTHSYHLAYIIYTSGSTGKPKGVAVEHPSLVNILLGLQDEYPLEEMDAYLFKTSYVFDVSLSEIFGWFFAGSRLVILERGGEKDAGKIVDIIDREAITHVNFVPSMFNTFIDVLNPGDLVKLSSLKYIMLAGESILPELVNKFAELEPVPGIKLENLYGPTEGTIYASGYSLSGWEGRGNIPIGKPLQNVKLYILSRFGSIQPKGVPGELWIGGVGLARGYLNNPELTAEKFDQDFWDYHDYQDENSQKFLRGGTGEFAKRRAQGAKRKQDSRCAQSAMRNAPSPPGHRGQKIYKTGDLAQWMADGNIQFFGRIDLQVKIRGFRIEMGEIENCLLKHGKIKEAVVMTREDKKGYKYLCAYLVSDNQPLITELREYLARLLPDYMIPSYFIYLRQIPLNSSGKINRGALPVPGLKAVESYIAPGNAMEEKLAGLFSDVLAVERNIIGLDSNFFELGGHSLKATILISKIHKELNVKLPMAEFFKTPTILGLSEYIKNLPRERYEGIEPVENKDYYPLSSSQSRLYFIQQFFPESIGYNMTQIVRLEGTLDYERLEDSLNKLITRHESLRTLFETIDGWPVQRIYDTVPFTLECYDLKNIESKYGGSRNESDIIMNFIRPFDLSTGPIIRVGVIKLEDKKHILMVDMHHIISDGVSHSVLMNDLTVLYKREELPPLRIQYKDYWELQNSRQKQKSLRLQEEYWLEIFKEEIPALDIPTDFPRPDAADFEGDHVDFEIGKQETQKLKKLASKENGTMFILTLAIYYVLLAKLSGNEDIVVGTAIQGRNHADLEKTIGIFINMLALRNFPVRGKTFRDFFKEVKERTVRAYENQDYQFDDLVEKVAVKRLPGRNPLIDIGFQLTDYTAARENHDQIKLPDLEIKPYSYQDKISHSDMIFHGYLMEKDLSFSVEYRTRLFKKDTIEFFIQCFKAVIATVLENPDIVLENIEIMPLEANRKIISQIKESNEELNVDFEYIISKQQEN